MAKKTERMQLDIEEDMARVVKEIADMEDRPYKHQLRRLVRVGLQHTCRKLRNRIKGNFSQVLGTFCI